VITPFPDLDDVLADFTRAVRAILGDAYVGTYLQGSFALGSGDRQSDADFIVVTTDPVSGDAEAALRRLHDEIPTRPGDWNRNLEGSYADAASLRSLAGLGVPWLFVDRGHREMAWDEHCNTVHMRWILRHHGIALDGPLAAHLIDDVPAQAMRDEADRALPGTLDGIRSWADLDNAWTQRYIVETHSRVLYTSVTGRVASKPAALQWAMDTLDARWQPLLAQVAADRARPWQPVDPPAAGSMALACEFAGYVVEFGAARRRERMRHLVRDGYDAISVAYRDDDGSSNNASAETTRTYGGWIDELSQLLPPAARVLDLGCGAGVPAARDLAARGYAVTGVDISAVQIERARRLVPAATFVCADMATWDAPAASSYDAIVSLYALIHVPLEDQQALFRRMREWLVPGGWLLAIVGARRWTGVEEYFGAEMFWDHVDAATYLEWFAQAGFEPQWHRFIPEGNGGHTLVLARALPTGREPTR
jgi:SAM-dependent methyltransferase/predicted nucleotidyltransferase